MSSGLRRGLAASAVLVACLAVARLVAAPSDADAPSELPVALDEAAMAEAEPPGAGRHAVQVGGPAPTSGPARGAAVAAPPRPAPAPTASVLTTPSPPREGTYAYRSTRDGVVEDAPLEVVDAGGGRRVESQAAGQRQVVQWGPDTRTLLTSTTGDAGSCAWSPAFVTLRWPLAAGTRWTSTGSCTIEHDGAAVVMERTEDVEVAASVRWRLDDGSEVDAWVIRRHAEVTSVFGGVRATSESAVSELFAPALGLAVYLTSRTVTPTHDGAPVTRATSAALVSTERG